MLQKHLTKSHLMYYLKYCKPMFIGVLLNYNYICMYVNRKCYVKWANKVSESFTVANGVKQGAVISPLLFSIYMCIIRLMMLYWTDIC